MLANGFVYCLFNVVLELGVVFACVVCVSDGEAADALPVRDGCFVLAVGVGA